MEPIKIENLNYLYIGVQGEHIAREIKIDVNSWLEEFPNVTFTVLFRNYQNTYPVPIGTVTVDEEGILTWTITLEVTQVPGIGYTEIRATQFYDEGAEIGLVKKTRMIPTKVDNSISGVDGATVPEDAESWVNTVIDARDVILNALQSVSTKFCDSDDGTEHPADDSSDWTDSPSFNKDYLWTQIIYNLSGGRYSYAYMVTYVGMEAAGVASINGKVGVVTIDGTEINVDETASTKKTIKAALAEKADQTDVTDALALKADQDDVDDALDLKADTTYVDTQLAGKAPNQMVSGVQNGMMSSSDYLLLDRIVMHDLTTATDLNNLTSTGIYFCRLNSYVRDNITNAPTGLTDAFKLEVIANDVDTQVLQRLTTYPQTGFKVYSRNAYSGDTTTYSWGAWVEWKLTDTNTWVANSASDNGYVAKGSGNANKYWRTDASGNPSWGNGYTHPSYTSKSSGLYKITVDSSGHVSGAMAVGKGDITALGIPGSDTNTTYSIKTVEVTATRSNSYSVSGTNNNIAANGLYSFTSSNSNVINNIINATPKTASYIGQWCFGTPYKANDTTVYIPYITIGDLSQQYPNTLTFVVRYLGAN